MEEPLHHGLYALCLVLLLCGCAALQHKSAAPQAAAQQAEPAKPASMPVAQLLRRPGGYYKDDGPDGTPPVDLENIADAQPKLEPLHANANDPYVVFGKEYVPERSFPRTGNRARPRGTGASSTASARRAAKSTTCTP